MQHRVLPRLGPSECCRISNDLVRVTDDRWTQIAGDRFQCAARGGSARYRVGQSWFSKARSGGSSSRRFANVNFDRGMRTGKSMSIPLDTSSYRKVSRVTYDQFVR
jgi:hypothetical protein